MAVEEDGIAVHVSSRSSGRLQALTDRLTTRRTESPGLVCGLYAGVGGEQFRPPEKSPVKKVLQS